jgi:hypothetical protein
MQNYLRTIIKMIKDKNLGIIPPITNKMLMKYPTPLQKPTPNSHLRGINRILYPLLTL